MPQPLHLGPCLSIISSPPPPPSSSYTNHHHHHPLVPHLQNCKSMHHLKEVHAKALRTSPSFPTPTLLFLYSRLLVHFSSINLSYASRLLFNPTFPNLAPSSFSFNTLIRSLSPSSLSILLFRHMLLFPLSPDNYTFPFVLKSCSFLFALSEGSQIHSLIFKLGFSHDTYVSNSLIHFYSSCNLLPLARCIFDRMSKRNRVSWNAIIDAYATAGHYETALSLFRQMQLSNNSLLLPDVFVLQSILRACAGLGSLSLGLWAHAIAVKKCSQEDDVLLNNSLLDLYSKCGNMNFAHQVFDRMLDRDVTSWNTLILGLATHGRVRQSLDVFAQMTCKPNSITFVAVLSACNHRGSVSEGWRYFNLMKDEFGIEPRLEHYGCMVDLLARAGLVDEALELIPTMPCKPDAVIWRSVLDACWKSNAGIEVSKSVALRALESEEIATSGAYVLLSKIYASANRWNDVGMVRGLMSGRGIRKEPGCSSIEIDGFVHEFVAGDTSHPRSKEIYEKLNAVESKLNALYGYKPDSSQASMVAGFEGSVRADSLRLHSERLAIAFGMISLRKGMAIRVLKNLRICRDCHMMTKLISQVYSVEIVVRDRTRFHHFKDGACSCRDYW